ncbi:MAG: 23S rRNA (uracil(1939)-C(5))-methyltransferase RlmD [Casimicrobiaceae bacterium]
MSTPVTIESLDQEGRGVARIDGKAVFVEGALPGEQVTLELVTRRPTFDLARTLGVAHANAARVTPRCPHFGVCGGCTLQHADPALQVAAKQRVLEEALARIGRVRPQTLLPPIHGPAWHYRWRARLSVRHVVKKGAVLVGFHERKSSFVADMRECHVVPQKLSSLLVPLRELIAAMTVRDRLPQIEVAIGERGGALVYVMVLRILAPLAGNDETLLRTFADLHGVEFWLQTGGPQTVVPFYPPSSTLSYTLPEFDIDMPFGPAEFTQVNPFINRMLVRRAMSLLQPAAGERVADFFCGLGNFTLPIARSGATVTGIEGSAAMVTRACENAAHNGLAANTHFEVMNLFATSFDSIGKLLPLDKALIDPPREGAIELAKLLPDADDPRAPSRIVYVSCNPATLARDASVLVHERGYTLRSAGVVNMFPHTAHVESVALFVRDAAEPARAGATIPA